MVVPFVLVSKEEEEEEEDCLAPLRKIQLKTATVKTTILMSKSAKMAALSCSAFMVPPSMIEGGTK